MALVKGKIRVGHTPDADDAFMFYGIASGHVNTAGLFISHVVEDIQSLNERAFRGELEVTAISAYAFFQLTDRYTLMTCGASVGDDYGPVVVSRRLCYPKEIKKARVALPGRWTTAHLALRLYESDFEPVFVPFQEVVATLEDGRADAAVVIHEGQVTYPGENLVKVLDLGEWFYEETKLPLPLGVDVVRTNLGPDLMRKIQRVFRDSIRHGLKHREAALDYAMRYARGTPREVIDRFIGMYVNDLTLDLGRRGKEGLKHLYESAKASGLVRNPKPIRFVPR